MPYQNRVDPWGALHAVARRGTLLGNRGIIHDANQNIVATHILQAWITCALAYKGKRRQIMSPRTWTELFFLDEVTAFSAGHRPCAYCRRPRYNAFKTAWLQANRHLLEGQPERINRIDRIIHRERIKRAKKVTYTAPLQSLPAGTMIELQSHAHVVWDGGLYQWSFSGYQFALAIQSNDAVTVLTPKSYVDTFRQGFTPQVHASVMSR